MKFLLAILLAVVPAAKQVQIVSHGPDGGRLVALTFDAGADRGYAPTILNVLERDHVPATFGMTGKWALTNKDLLRRITRDDDALINHTYDHRSFTGLSTHTAPLSTRQRIWEIRRTEQIVRTVVGRSLAPYFRPPFGDYDPATLWLLRQLGYRYMVMWTLDTLGWEHLPAPSILQRCLDNVTPGSIVLMHVGSQSQDALALPDVITRLRQRHYRFVTVPQLLRSH